jgi:pyruvate/2-oxoglutarate dehydrogenase complex dihydrolipoamide dehydrogenase (E3) component
MHLDEDGVPKFLVIVGQGWSGMSLAYVFLK